MSIALIIQLIELAIQYGPKVVELIHELLSLLHHNVQPKSVAGYLGEIEDALKQADAKGALEAVLGRIHQELNPPTKAA